MSEEQSTPTTIDEYIAGFPPDVQEKLQQIRALIKDEAPQAQETISYGVAAFKLHGPLIYFAGFKNHLSVYPAPRGYPQFEDELAAYKGGKGTVQFPLNKPIPFDLIRRIVRFRLEENLKKAEAKGDL